MEVRAVLVDDETKALELLKSKLKSVCNLVQIVGEFSNPEDAIEFINNNEFDILFLDISMPRINGFDLLKQLTNHNFELIMVTAYNEYALEAIKHTAVGYVLKPVDEDELGLALFNARKSISQKGGPIRNKTLLENLEQEQFRDKKVAIPTTQGVEYYNVSSIIRCEGYEGYTKIYFDQFPTILSSFNIGHYAKLLDSDLFYLIHKSHLVNLDFVVRYSNEGNIHLKNGAQVPVSRRKRKEFLDLLNAR